MFTLRVETNGKLLINLKSLKFVETVVIIAVSSN